MVKKILGFFNKEYRNVHGAAFVLAGFTFLSQIFGLVRDRLLAGRIGPGETLDIYVTAFQIPDIVFAIGASLVSVTILIPFLNEYIQNHDLDEQRFLDSIFSSFMIFMVVISAILFIIMPFLAPLIAPGFSPHMMPDLIATSRIMLLSPILLGMSNLFGSITQLYRKFFVYALSPILYNAGIIVGIVWLYPIYGIAGLAYGVLIGAFLHMVIQVPVIVQKGFIPHLILKRIDWPLVWKVATTSLPRTFALAFSQIVITVLIAFATHFGTGAPSIFRFAMVIYTVPISMIGISYSVAAFPLLVEKFKQGNQKDFIEALMVPARKIIFWSLPIIILFIVLRAQIVRVVLGTGAFDWGATRLTAALLAILVICVAFRGLINLFIRGYYAAGKTWGPFVINAVSTVFTIVCAVAGVMIFERHPILALWLEKTFRIQNIENTGLIILALSYSIGTCMNFFALWMQFKKDFSVTASLWSRNLLESILASLVLGLVSYGALQIFDTVFNLNTFTGVFMDGLLAGALGSLASVGILFLLGNSEIQYVVDSIKKRFI